MTRVLVTEKGLLVKTAETVTGKDLVIEEGLKEDRWQQEMALEEESELYMTSIFSAIVFVGLLFPVQICLFELQIDKMYVQYGFMFHVD